MILGHMRNKKTLFQLPSPIPVQDQKEKSQPELLLHEMRQLGGPLVAYLSVFFVQNSVVL